MTRLIHTSPQGLVLSILLIMLVIPAVYAVSDVTYTSMTPTSGIETNDTSLFVQVYISDSPADFETVTFNLFDSSRTLVSSHDDSNLHAFNLEHYSIIVENENLDLGADQSGLAYSPTTDTVYSVRNSVGAINELYRNGTMKREITTSGFQDIEAITFLNHSGGYDWFAITEEQKQTFSIIKIDATTSRILFADSINYDLGLGHSPNNGLEGITYDHRRGVFYIAKEKLPMALYRVDVSSGSPVVTTLFDAESVFRGIANDLSDIYYDKNTDNLFILSHQSNKLMQVKLDGTLVNSFRVSLIQAEGVTFDTKGDTLWVMSEPDSWNIYKAQNFTTSYNFSDLSDGLYFYNVVAHGVRGGGSTSVMRNITIGTIVSSTSSEISRVNLRSSSTTNTTSEDLILSWNLSGADEDRVKVVTSWYVNDQIINILNLPFEAGSNSETTFDFAS
ncbi:SdiA-regulated domain-containing protein, partial [Candidatus Micrarchaeota archaeon]|nr:SdiA-regulated domain-containing protein [Candidatus Micrarchaeota archaeon]MBU1165607.1 SdiA-regulated domain-containing protein [Candidatus Micrarchaeota archaeon]MBU1887164.1 SdiA-regulated domain-containing protein [Candidatus Micrarchaeota archaeon]